MNTLGIYIHVPFCGKKCSYCDFYSLSYNKKNAELYLRAVLRNIQYYSDRSRVVNTVYFGGGTPSILPAESIAQMLKEIRECFRLSENPEITLEANPNTLTPDKLRQLHDHGVNRLSIGIQSMLDSELKFLGRTHTAARAKKAVLDAADTGFRNISCDLMIALPNQTAESVKFSINELTALPVNHISAYILKIEEGTPFDNQNIHNIMPDDDSTAELYLNMVDLLKKKGFTQYEISNFAKDGFESRHNCRYWKCRDYLGIGPAAHSCYKGKRFAVMPNLQEFIDAPHQKIYITDESPCGFEESAMLRIRLAEGLNIGECGDRADEIIKKIPQLQKAGYVTYENGRLALTAKGFLMSNSIIEYLIF